MNASTENNSWVDFKELHTQQLFESVVHCVSCRSALACERLSLTEPFVGILIVCVGILCDSDGIKVKGRRSDLRHDVALHFHSASATDSLA